MENSVANSFFMRRTQKWGKGGIEAGREGITHTHYDTTIW